ncbi:carbon monoxide dehydrogenase beta subunit family protein [Desulfobotulus mexicanus]|uniref:Carbon monoxide dehydrogenase n=1 Tax=Desulfobotulus mexicanus TaxID=2586642 RepID=A0A5Q4VEC3_9BACT|nr:carbon monoxide dehydrogenase beta subunit family protein [Desulfobotulus mexicanus]TYT76049.1 carbon monoxide dehydrogenase [Desulfobotulus mexicanus]
MRESSYKVLPGPEGYLPPAAATMGVMLPDPGQAIMEGESVDRDIALRAAARKLIEARNPVFFPGPLILWDWKPGVAEKATALKELAEAVGAKMIPMPDYRPKYPMINPAIEVNPNHPNLTIWHNKIDVCLFIGVHCHYANLALKIIRGGTDCYTIAVCAEAGHEEAMISLRDAGLCELQRLRELVIELKGGKNQ